jgi:hypothetical protein
MVTHGQPADPGELDSCTSGRAAGNPDEEAVNRQCLTRRRPSGDCAPCKQLESARRIWLPSPGGDEKRIVADEGRIIQQAAERVPLGGRDQASVDEPVSDLVDVGDPQLSRGRTAVEVLLVQPGGLILLTDFLTTDVDNLGCAWTRPPSKTLCERDVERLRTDLDGRNLATDLMARVMAGASDAATESYPAHMTDSRLSPEEIRAAAEVHRELGPEYSDAVVASFLEKVDREVAARVEARLAGMPRTEPAKPGSRRMLLTGMAIGVAVGGIPLLLLLVMQAGRGSPAAASPNATGGNVTQVVVSHSSHSVVWVLLLLIVMAICAVAAVRVVRKQRAAGPL